MWLINHKNLASYLTIPYIKNNRQISNKGIPVNYFVDKKTIIRYPKGSSNPIVTDFSNRFANFRIIPVKEIIHIFLNNTSQLFIILILKYLLLLRCQIV